MINSYQPSDEERKLDPQGMGNLIHAMSDHAEDALTIAKKALGNSLLPHREVIRNIVVCGMGGSAIGGDLVATYLRDELAVPMQTIRSYTPGAQVGKGTLAIISSYSGGTDESLSLYEHAKKRGATIVAITSGGKLEQLARDAGQPVIIVPGGYQPRAALAYSFVPLLAIVTRAMELPDPSSAIHAMSSHLKELAGKYGPHIPEENNPARQLARKLVDKIAVVYSSESIDSINLRWRGQMQENAKHLAFGNLVPELGHNEISGWSHPKNSLQTFSIIFLRSKEDEHPDVSKKIEAINQMLYAKGIQTTEHFASGASKLERMFALIALADWTSFYLALLSGTDPTPIPAIDEFKSALKI